MKPQNRLLAFLPNRDLALLEPHFKRKRFTRGDILIGSKPFKNILFLESGSLSYVSLMEDGAAVESISIGREGAIGLAAWIGPVVLPPIRRGIVQISGEGLAISIEVMNTVARESEAIQDMTRRYTTFLLSHFMQLVACNACHSVEARLARWLLTCAYRIDDQVLEFQHDYLAETLGVVRTTITLAARSLQAAGVILYSRGRIQILDVDGLNDLACDCYGVFRSELERLLPVSQKRIAKAERSRIRHFSAPRRPRK